jgi:pyridoxine 4-dehydrogenase
MGSTISGGTLALADDLVITRMGFGAMQLAGPNVFGPPRDRGEAIAVLRAVVEHGVTHIDTSDFYGPAVVNELIRAALHPYPEGLHVVTKVGARRGADGSWLVALERADLIEAVHSNLRHLGVEVLDLVNLRLSTLASTSDESIEEPFGVLAQLQAEGLIRHLGVSGASAAQVVQAQSIAPVVSVQNLYNLANRQDDDLVDACARAGIAFVPFFPLGGFSPLQAGGLLSVAARLGASTQQVALAWLLQRSPAIALIPGTSSTVHLRENLAAADLVLPPEAVIDLDRVGSSSRG